MRPRKIILELVVRDPRGRILARRRKRAGYLKNILAFLRAQIIGLTETLVDIGGTSRSIALGYAATTPTIRVGSGTTPQAPGDYKLVTELGTVAASAGPVVVVGSNSQFTISGSVAIAAGGTVQEVGYSFYYQSWTFLLLRDVVPPVVVPAGGTCTVAYTLIFTA